MDDNINLVEEQCRAQIQAYVKCVDSNPETWQTICSTEKKNLNDCSSVNPIIQFINKACGKEFKTYDKCIKDNPDKLQLCFEVLETFNKCASKASQDFKTKFS